jgi:AP-1 complex subunit gamma-1
VNEYIITALMKLTTRISNAAQIERIRRTLQTYSDSLDVEIQQRAVEYGNMFGYDEIRSGVLEKMPPPVIKEVSRVFEREAPKPKVGKKSAKKQTEEELLDLMGGEPVVAPAANGGGGGNMELLSDILGSGDTGAAPAQQPAQSNINSIMDLFNTPANPSPAPQSQPAPAASGAALLAGLGVSPSPSSSPAPPLSSASPPAQAYNKNDLLITLQLARTADGTVNVVAKFKNTSFADRIVGVNLQAAVPKSMQLRLQPISNAELEPDGEATQMMRVTGSKGVSVFLFLIYLSILS